MPTPHVFDLYHGDEIDDWKAIVAAGVVGVIHKSSQGTRMVDPAYANRRRQAREAGLLWGAYHFGTGDDVAAQVEHFLSEAKPDADTLMCLDWEPNGRGGTMTVAQARQFVTLVKEKTGRWPVLYTGSLAKERLPAAGDDVLNNCRLWLSQYGPRPKCPPGWTAPWLWQFTGDGEGPGPHQLPGVRTHGIDLSQAAAPDRLAAEWSGQAAAPVAAIAAVESGIDLPEQPVSRSKTVKASLANALAGALTLASAVGAGIDKLLAHLPDIKTDVETQLDALKSLGTLVGDGLHVAVSPPMLAGITIALSAYTIYRRMLPRGA